MTALLYNFMGGSLNVNLLTAGTVISSSALESVPVISAPDTMTIVLDPDGIAGAPEIVHVTNHAFGSTTATVVRGQEDTIAREHKSGTNWVHSLTVGLFESLGVTGGSGGGGGTGSGVIAQDEPPSSPADYELWLDTDAPAPVTDALQVVPSLLAIKSYSPGTGVVLATTTSFADVDATNAAITFTVPESGQVRVRVDVDGYANASNLNFQLAEGASAVPGTDTEVLYSSAANTVRLSYEVFITGLTPGATKTYKLQHKGNSTSSATRYGGTSNGALVMQVHDAATSQGTVWNVSTENALNAWQPFTPTWTATTTNPALGNGTLSGAYTQIGKTVHFRMRLVMGSTTTFGSGSWEFALPVAAHADLIGTYGLLIAGYAEDVATLGYGVPGGRMSSGGTKFMVHSPSGGVYTPTTPFTWGSGDFFSIHGTYEAA